MQEFGKVIIFGSFVMVIVSILTAIAALSINSELFYIGFFGAFFFGLLFGITQMLDRKGRAAFQIWMSEITFGEILGSIPKERFEPKDEKIISNYSNKILTIRGGFGIEKFRKSPVQITNKKISICVGALFSIPLIKFYHTPIFMDYWFKKEKQEYRDFGTITEVKFEEDKDFGPSILIVYDTITLKFQRKIFTEDAKELVEKIKKEIE